MLLPDDYIKAMADAIHEVGGVMVLDCIASGTLWVDMKSLGVDVLISAPQKGWTGPSCAGLIMLSEKGMAAMESSSSDSFTVNLKQWNGVMESYLKGGFAYHTTMPTDGLALFRDIMLETKAV